MPFGFGPRSCVGMRFAEFEIRIALAVLLKKFRFVNVESSPELPVEVDTSSLTKPKRELSVRAERR
jgi:cytochrome P450